MYETQCLEHCTSVSFNQEELLVGLLQLRFWEVLWREPKVINASLSRQFSNVTATFTYNMCDKYLLECICLCAFTYSDGKIVCFKIYAWTLVIVHTAVMITNIVGDSIEIGMTACIQHMLDAWSVRWHTVPLFLCVCIVAWTNSFTIFTAWFCCIVFC